MGIKRSTREAVRSRYLIDQLLFADSFYSLFIGYDQQQCIQNVILKFYKGIVNPQFVDFCIKKLSSYQYVSLEGMFELIDYEFDGENFYLIYKKNVTQMSTMDYFLNKNSLMGQEERCFIVNKIAKRLCELEKNNFVFGSMSLNNIFVSESNYIILGPAMINAICLEYYRDSLDQMDSCIFFPPEFFKLYQLSTKTDIYSFGVMSFYILTSNWPYPNNGSILKLKKSFQKGPQLPVSFVPSIKGNINYGIIKSLQLDDALRWVSFQQIINMLNDKVPVPNKKIINKDNTSTIFMSEIKNSRRVKRGQVINWISNFVLVFFLIFFIYIAYQAYFKTYAIIEVPNLDNVSTEVAMDQLVKLNLKPKVMSYNYHPTIPENHVIRLEPKYGRSIKEGRMIKLFISKGRQEILVPNIIGKSLEESSFILSDYNIIIEAVEREYSYDIDEGLVIQQIPLPNQYIFDDGTIQVITSHGSPIQVDLVDEIDEDISLINVEVVFFQNIDIQKLEILEEYDDNTQLMFVEEYTYNDKLSKELMIHKTAKIIFKLNDMKIYEFQLDKK